MNIECPSCHTGDHLQKVSVIVASGTTTGSFSGPIGGITYSDGKIGESGGFSSLSGKTATVLAQVLTPPKEPHISLLGRGITCFVTQAIIGIVGFSCGAGVIILSYSSKGTNFLTIFLGDAVILSLMIIASIISYRYFSKRAKNKYIAEKALWDIAMEKWHRLWFCSKCGIVIDEETNVSFSPNQMHEYLYQI